MLDTADQRLRVQVRAQCDDALADMLGVIADRLDIVAFTHRDNDLAQIHRHPLSPRDGRHRHLIDLALHRIERRIGGDDVFGKVGIVIDQRADSISDLLFGAR